MKRFLLLGICYVLLTPVIGQTGYWQQHVDYRIDVTLNDKDHSIDGFEKIIYTNNAPDTLRFIWFHIWPNAYKNDKTAFSDQLLENGNTKFYFANKEQRGYINRLDFKVNNVTANVADHPQHIDIIRVDLPTPLAPGQQVTITTPFHVKLPYNFSRGGHEEQSYQLTQWYPKPAVYDAKGWHEMPYLDQGEFYSEFGNFNVNIALPENYVVAATGTLGDQHELDWMKTQRSSSAWGKQYRAMHPMHRYDTIGYPTAPIKASKPGQAKASQSAAGFRTQLNRAKDSISNVTPLSSAKTKTLSYTANNVHDFAWFADKRFIVEHDTLTLPSGKTIDVFSFYTPRGGPVWQHSIRSLKQSVQHYSTLVGEYPYPVVAAVQGPQSFGGGMEYPMITVISPKRNSRELDNTIAHEVGHNWFFGILASNERDFPWMDEGINSYYETRYSLKQQHHYNQETENTFMQTLIAEKMDQPISTSSTTFNETNYNTIGYYKTSLWMELLEKELGTVVFNTAMQEYYRRWQFKHPQPADFKKVMEDVSGKNLDATFALLDKKGPLPAKPRKGVAILGVSAMLPGAYREKNTLISILPVPGFNSYDKLMLGAVITNMRLPPNKFQFLALPIYAFGSKSMTGLGLVNYSFYPGGAVRKIDIGVSGARFSMDRFVDQDGNKTFLGVDKIVPGIRLTFNQKNPRSTIYRYLQFKTFLIGEDDLRFRRDSVFTPTDTIITLSVGSERETRTLNQLQFVIENNRALYPYRAELKVEQAKNFVRAAFTGNYFFNYPKGGGLDVRLFAGKFIYTGEKTISKEFATDRYHLNMTGPNGYEDYTYSDYFIGRNLFDGFASQQIMNRDGGFKVRTELLSEKVGRSDDWLGAVNFTTTIPNAINPLSLLPVKIPLKLFVDIGTSSDAWKPNADQDRFIYDAGLQVSLFKETINIFLPLLYSRVFKDYIQSTIEKKGRIWKTMSFNIDISHFNIRKFDRRLSF